MARFHLFLTEWCIYIHTYIYIYIYMNYILCIYIHTCIYICVCVCACHILIHSSTDKIIGCLHILVIVNNVSMNIEVCISFQISVFVCFEYSGVEYLNCIVDLFLIF